MAELTRGLDTARYSIVLDHQPHDYDAEAASGVDLVLSGHTHGGQLIPLVQLIRWFHLHGDDAVDDRSGAGIRTFSSRPAFPDWAILFKTGCRSEYVIIEIQGT